MKAMIFAAGLGTRLRPFTDNNPKALFPVAGKTLLELSIIKLKKFGIQDIVINVHHYAAQMIDYLNKNKNFGCNIFISNERDELLNTGGGLKFASKYLDGNEAFLVINVDILTNLDFAAFYKYHQEKGGLATLAVQERETSRYLLFDDENRLSGWEDVRKSNKIIARYDVEDYNHLAFSGIHIIEPAIFKLFIEHGSFSIIDLYLRLAETQQIYGFNHSRDIWFDVGKIDHTYEAELKFELMADSYKL